MPMMWLFLMVSMGVVYYVFISITYEFFMESSTSAFPSKEESSFLSKKSFLMSSLMVCGLFSSFDPGIVSSGGESSYNYKWFFSFLLLFFIFGWQLFPKKVGLMMFFSKMMKELYLMALQLGFSPKKISVILCPVFLILMLTNLLGLSPFSFSLTSHLSVNLTLSLPLFLGGLLILLNKVSFFFAHMVPEGSPSFLLPLLVMVESVSLIIRPFTLGVRLMANVMAGHMILSLASSSLSGSGILLSPIVVSGFLGFEMCVSLVQAFVFSSLLLMYWKESI